MLSALPLMASAIAGPYDNLVAWITDPQQLKPGTLMPKLPLTQADVVELASFLSKMKQR